MKKILTVPFLSLLIITPAFSVTPREEPLSGISFIRRLPTNYDKTKQFGAEASFDGSFSALYTFDGNSNDSKGGNNGITHGSPTYTTGKVGQAISLDGVDDYVETDKTKSAELNGLNAVTLSYWIKPKVVSGYPLGRWGSNRQFAQTFISNRVRMYWRVGGTGSTGTSIDHIASKTINANEWAYITVVYNNPTSKIYINGVLDSAKDGVGGALNSSVSDALVFGRNTSSTGGGYFNGEIDNVYVYSRALSDSEIANFYTLAGGTPPSNPQPMNTPTPTPSTSTPDSSAATGAASYYVSQTGSDTNTGTESAPLKTIQKAADLARAGTTVYVLPGTYAEKVVTKSGGTQDSNRVTFKAQGPAGSVVLQGFRIVHPYVTLEGFDFTGNTSTYSSHIQISAYAPNGALISKGDYCKILNNRIRDNSARVAGIGFGSTAGFTADNCIVRGNTISNIFYVFLNVAGNNHLFENNTLEYQNSMDYVRVFGKNHTFRRNIFWKGTVSTATGNHPDWIQTFSDNGGESKDHLFEENYIEGLEGSQLAQLNSGSGPGGNLSPNFKNITFRRNVFANVAANFNGGLPGITFDHNTFYRNAYTLGGVAIGGSLTRGDGSNALLSNNAFVAGADGTSMKGFYSLTGISLSEEAIDAFVTKEGTTFVWPIAKAIKADLQSRGYINSNGRFLPAGRAITDISQLVISDAYASYQPALYATYKRALDLDNSFRASVLADFNFVAGLPSDGYPPKRSDKCTEGVLTSFRFCEPHGINGGDPKFQSITDLLGPDGKIFTLDDGLKPQPGSPLCGKGVGGSDIGAYSCDPTEVFAK